MANTIEQRQVSHNLADAWEGLWGAINLDADEYVAARIEDMSRAVDAIIAAHTPGYNAESDPEYPEEIPPRPPTPDIDDMALDAENRYPQGYR